MSYQHNYVVILIVLTLIALISSSTAAPSLTAIVKDVENDVVQVTWNGVTEMTDGDVIVIFSVLEDSQPPIADSDDRKTLGFYKVTELDQKGKGEGSIDIPLYISRDRGFYFEYLRIDKFGQTIICHSEVLKLHRYNRAHHFRLALTHVDTQMRVSYTTIDEPSIPHFIQVSHVPFRDASPSSLSLSSPSPSPSPSSSSPTLNSQYRSASFYTHSNHTGTYTFDQMVEAPANVAKNWMEPGNFRSGIISSLKHDTIYYYRVVDDVGKPLSRQYMFISPSKTGGTYSDVFVFGDSGVGFPFYTEIEQQTHSLHTVNNIYQTIKERHEEGDFRHSTLLHIGDISYARGYAWLWEFFMKQIEPLSSYMPYMITLGNHEINWLKQPFKPDWSDYGTDSGGEKGIPSYQRFIMPPDFTYYPYKEAITNDETKQYNDDGIRSVAYAFDVGVVHFIVFSAEHDFTDVSAQYAFIEKDLQQVDRKRTPWVVLTAHRPTYCSTMGCSIAKTVEPKKMDYYIRQTFQPLMIKYKVSLGIFGHNHHYERTCPMVNDYECVQGVSKVIDGIEHLTTDAPVHVVTGSAGNAFNPPWQPYNPMVAKGSSINHHVQPDHITFRSMQFGYSHLHANMTHLTFKFYANQRRTVHDHFVLLR